MAITKIIFNKFGTTDNNVSLGKFNFQVKITPLSQNPTAHHKIAKFLISHIYNPTCLKIH